MPVEHYRWKTARPKDFGTIEVFLRQHEPYLVGAASRFIVFLPGRDQFVFNQDRDNRIGAFLFRSGGILHPYFLDYPPVKASRILRRFVGLPFHKRIYSVQGLIRDVSIAEESLSEEAYQVQDQFDYYLMHLVMPVRSPPLPEGLRIVDNPAPDLVYPLQAAYEKEEVIPAHSGFHEPHCRLGLERIFKEETLVYAEYEGLPAAKANTNARSFTYCQIGGVYVRPELRGRGIASYVVGTLVERIQQKGLKVSLFVKKRNLAAQRVYEKLGFETIGEYRINYYRG